jgi:uncharacterized protein (DUF302 family)
MSRRHTAVFSAAAALIVALAGAGVASMAAAQSVGADGLISVRSGYGMDETIARLKKDIADKGILLFGAIDQAKLASDAGIELHPSTLLVFGNPPLGTQFMTSNPNSGLDWPVRLLVHQNAKGEVWTTYTDFSWIARRHAITDRVEQFGKATGVIASITAAVVVADGAN